MIAHEDNISDDNVNNYGGHDLKSQITRLKPEAHICRNVR